MSSTQDGRYGDEEDPRYIHTISVVIPVYQGEKTLPNLVDELEILTKVTRTPRGLDMRVDEVLLCFDNGPDGSAATIRELAARFDYIRPIWLSRNFGQHAATLAGMASSGSDWIVTMDEDGQHDPGDIGRFLDTAVREQAALVYANPINPPPHGAWRNATSAATKWIFAHAFSSGDVTVFQSYRLILGEVGRSVAAYAGSGVFLDVAIGWVSGRGATCDTMLRDESGRRSGYTFRRLLSHFWRMVISSGTRGLRLVSAIGLLCALGGIMLAVGLIVARLTTEVVVEGWTSVVVAILLGTGLILSALGIIAEYLGTAVNMAMGKPLYLIVGDPANGPLGRDRGTTTQD